VYRGASLLERRLQSELRGNARELRRRLPQSGDLREPLWRV
jgi:hypothetical protein